MIDNLKNALMWLGKYINRKPEVVLLDDGEWMTFTVLVRKHSKGVIGFANPSLTVGVVNTNEYSDDNNVVVLNEFHYAETSSLQNNP